MPRGRYAFETVRLTIEDPFGLARTSLVQGEPQALVVYPRLVALDRLFSEGGAHAQDGRRLLLRRPTGYELHSVREYAEGESLRKVHWRSTARRGRLMVKELEDAPRDEVAVLLDGDARGRRRRRASRSPCARPARSCRRTCAGAGAARSSSTRPRASRSRVTSEGDWRRALEVLAGAEPTRARPRSRSSRSDGGIAARSLELVVVTSRVDAALVDRLVQRALSRRGASLVYVETAPGPEPQLLRLLAAGIPVAVVRPATISPRRSPAGRRALPRTLLTSLIPAAVIATTWLRLESPINQPLRSVAVAGLAVLPALVRRWLRGSPRSCSRRATRVSIAYGVSPLHPRHLPGAIWSRFSGGFLDFYDVQTPFDPRVHAEMRACCSPRCSASRSPSRSRWRRGARFRRCSCSSPARAGPRRCAARPAGSSSAASSCSARSRSSPG